MTKRTTGIATNGIGQITTAHLNLTRPMITYNPPKTHRPEPSKTPRQHYQNRFIAEYRNAEQ